MGGTNKGAALVAPKGAATRPTSDRMRETIFNILAHRFGGVADDTRVLDLFAGTGAMGLEAISRGAAFALFVENSPGARGTLRTNMAAVNATSRARVWRRDATKLGACPVAPFDLIFCDPPYGRDLGVAALAAALDGGWVSDDALAVLEERRGSVPERLSGWQRLDGRKTGESEIVFLRPDTKEEPENLLP
ncbi:MAG: 16S rRNA (guanine(966)-N(2))-methyltransferase RsmD [Pseudomonadota bacterium]